MAGTENISSLIKSMSSFVLYFIILKILVLYPGNEYFGKQSLIHDIFKGSAG